MKKYFILIFVNIFLATLQLSFFSELFGIGLAPDLLLAFAFGLAFLDLNEEAYFSGFVGGIFLDLLGFSIIGSSSVLYVGILLIFVLIQKFISKGMFMKVLGFILFSFVLASIKSDFIFLQQLFSSLLSLLITFIFYGVLQRLVIYFRKTGYNINRL